MSNPFRHLGAIPAALQDQDRERQERSEAVRRTKHSAALALGPSVIGVLENFRSSALPQMQSHTQASEKDSYYYWAIGRPAQVDGYKYFWSAIQVTPVFAESGEITHLATSVHVPNFKSYKSLGERYGISFSPERDGDAGGGATATATVTHAPTEAGLVEALLRLFPEEYLRQLLVMMRQGRELGTEGPVWPMPK